MKWPTYSRVPQAMWSTVIRIKSVVQVHCELTPHSKAEWKKVAKVAWNLEIYSFGQELDKTHMTSSRARQFPLNESRHPPTETGQAARPTFTFLLQFGEMVTR